MRKYVKVSSFTNRSLLLLVFLLFFFVQIPGFGLQEEESLFTPKIADSRLVKKIFSYYKN